MVAAPPLKPGEPPCPVVEGPTGVAVGLDPEVDCPPAPPVEIVPLDGVEVCPVEPAPVDKMMDDRVLDGQ